MTTSDRELVLTRHIEAPREKLFKAVSYTHLTLPTNREV